MWYKRIYKYLRLFLLIYPWFFWFIMGVICDDKHCPVADQFSIFAKIFLISYIWGAILIFCIFWIYTLFLIKNKILYSIEQLIKKYCKIFKIKKKKIWRYPIVTQYTPPKWLTSMEVSYLYNLRHFKWNISCLFYKWAAEKRISIDFKKWDLLSFDKVEIKIINNSLIKMSEEEKFQWDLIFKENNIITLPDIDLLERIPIINIQTAKSCLDKNLIEPKFSITVTGKLISKFFALLWVISFLYFVYRFVKHLTSPYVILIPYWISILMLFRAITMDHQETTKITHYKLSEKWKETLAEIYWYKYFFEACDEQKIKSLLKNDPEYLDKTMPYAIALWVETEIIESVSPNILDWINNNRYVWDLSSIAKTMITSSERTILLPTEKLTKNNTKESISKKILKINKGQNNRKKI